MLRKNRRPGTAQPSTVKMLKQQTKLFINIIQKIIINLSDFFNYLVFFFQTRQAFVIGDFVIKHLINADIEFLGNFVIITKSGTTVPLSRFEMVRQLTSQVAANSSCVIPAASRIALTFKPRYFFTSSFILCLYLEIDCLSTNNVS